MLRKDAEELMHAIDDLFPASKWDNAERGLFIRRAMLIDCGRDSWQVVIEDHRLNAKYGTPDMKLLLTEIKLAGSRQPVGYDPDAKPMPMRLARVKKLLDNANIPTDGLCWEDIAATHFQLAIGFRDTRERMGAMLDLLMDWHQDKKIAVRIVADAFPAARDWWLDWWEKEFARQEQWIAEFRERIAKRRAQKREQEERGGVAPIGSIVGSVLAEVLP